jgi:hypothetical protein
MSFKRTATAQRSTIAISAADIVRARHQAPAALDYYRSFGLAESRSRALNILFSGAVPLAGMVFFDWSIYAMLMYMVADAVVTTVADIIRYPIARKWLAASHKIDHESGRILLICDGLEDGSGQRADTGDPVAPGLILFFGFVSTIFLVPIIAASVDHIGAAPLRAVLNSQSFLWAVAIDASWRWITSLVGAIAVRFTKPGERMIFLDSGGVAVLYACLLLLIWLPIKLGAPGLYAMFIIIYVVRLGFGLFAFWWTPRSVKNLQRRYDENDFSIKKKSLP